ncbi:response regulator transcription factor [Christiangramia aquimixticola]|uniref:response regulator transcription factor n=1 Tax=Christiangramia aquimixticola TaxID=1697558 RepID=UPI003AA8AE53
MKIYESDFLEIRIEKENDCFVQFWKQSPDSNTVLKEELSKYCELYKKFKPSKTLWLQERFRLPVDQETHAWIEEYVNIPCVENGCQKVAFVVGTDVLVHLSIMSHFEKMKSVISPLHFASEKEARQWLEETKSQEINPNKDVTILFEGVDEEGNSIIKIKRPSSDISNTIRSFANLIEENEFLKKNISKFTTLTKREKQVMVSISKGLKQQEVADELFISIGTLRTHWKNIKSKLEIKSLADVIKYVNAFDLNGVEK